MKIKVLFMSLFLVMIGSMFPIVSVSAQENNTIYTEQITGDELEDIRQYMISNIISTMATKYSVNWTVPANTRYKTGTFLLNGNITCLLYTSPSPRD